jgi:hypothetical protein
VYVSNRSLYEATIPILEWVFDEAIRAPLDILIFVNIGSRVSSDLIQLSQPLPSHSDFFQSMFSLRFWQSPDVKNLDRVFGLRAWGLLLYGIFTRESRFDRRARSEAGKGRQSTALHNPSKYFAYRHHVSAVS